MSEKIRAFIQADLDKVEKLLDDNPQNLTVAAVAEFLGMDIASVRAAIEGGTFGISWRKTGKVNKAYYIPTAIFVRWYLNVNVLESVYREVRM